MDDVDWRHFLLVGPEGEGMAEPERDPAADPEVDPSAVVDRLERNVMSLGVYLERHALEEADDGTTLHLEYETAAGGLAQGDLGSVCTELVDAHEAGWEPLDCRLWAFDTEGFFLGEWFVRGGWFRALDRGLLTETDFSTLVLSTREPADDPPAPAPASPLATAPASWTGSS